ncbi:cysteine desulfurase family protein [Aureitalea marina]|uniref:cysteine desulfurase n=1 Tax=Aureitalea marina TaxID=930804 RepID=A0A2S7KTK0_9FLAO|nr:cysteine desulfurase family protein [Aureitalea marina]PQB05959.1 cysteine desulfurase [Aureitalea marina]
MRVYFDSAATTQLRDEVVNKMAEVLKSEYGNPSSTHSYGRSSKALLEQARKDVAAHLKVEAGEIIFTSGGTEADNLIIHSCVDDLGVERIITSPIEHHAVLHCVEDLAEKRGVEVEYTQLLSCGSIDLEHLSELLANSQKKTLVSLMHVNNEIGNMLDLETVARMCKEAGALIHSDTVQSVGHFDMDFSQIPVDFAAVAAHKFHGPKGAGFAFVRKNTGLRPLIHGGAQERGLRAGTEAVYAIVGLAEALNLSYQNLEEESAYIAGLKQYFIEELGKAIPNAKFNGGCTDIGKSTYTLINVCIPMPAQKALMLLFQLDLKGIACSKGSACQSGSSGGSHVLKAIQSPEELQNPSLRFSFSHYNTKDEIDYVVGVLKDFLDS